MVTEVEVLVSTVRPSGELGATNTIYTYTQRHTYTHTYIHTYIHTCAREIILTVCPAF